jgi:VIT1/CCC1 family predicted Fe2+/Mn2+ transporter
MSRNRCSYAFGAALGILGMFIMPEFPASDYLTAAAVGIVSGLAATGINQVYKQLTKEG